MKNIILFFLILTASSAFSCKKKDLTFTLKGVVSDSSFGNGLEGAVLKLTEISSGNSTTESLITETTLSADGSFEITFKRNSAIKYKLNISKKNYFEINAEIPFSEFSTEKALVKNYATNAKAWVKLHFINQTVVSDDEMRFIKQDGKADCIECCPKTDRYIFATADTFFYCVNDGNTAYSYYYWSNNPQSQGFESINTPAFDTVELIKVW